MDNVDGELENMTEQKVKNRADLLARQQKTKYYQKVWYFNWDGLIIFLECFDAVGMATAKDVWSVKKTATAIPKISPLGSRPN